MHGTYPIYTANFKRNREVRCITFTHGTDLKFGVMLGERGVELSWRSFPTTLLEFIASEKQALTAAANAKLHHNMS
jgi:hypothetical protein